MAKATRKSPHRPPAQIRYEKSHPTVSFRVSRDIYDLLNQRLKDLGDVSFADFVKESLGLQQLKMPDIDEIEGKAWGEGYDEAKEEHQIWYYCNVCGERIDIEPDSDSHKAMIGFMREQGWGHTSCHK